VIFCDYIDELGMYYLYTHGEFDLEIMKECRARLFEAGETVASLARPVIQDISDVELTESSLAEFRRHINQGVQTGENKGSYPIAVHVGSLGSYGMMRMYTALAEAAELRHEGQLFHSMHQEEVARWFSNAIGLGDPERIVRLMQRKRLEAIRACRSAQEPVLWGPGLSYLVENAA
jgi:hypothetical protein